MIAAVAVSPEEGTRIVDSGPSERDHSRKAARKQAHVSRTAMEVAGVLRHVLHGPKGEVRGLLLEDGRGGRFPPHAAKELASLLVPGTQLLLRGDGFTTGHGTVIAIRAIGTSPDDLRRLDAKAARNKHDKLRRHDRLNGEPDAPHAA
jgi:hypothetical protein